MNWNHLLLYIFTTFLIKPSLEHGMMRLRNTSLRLLISCKYKIYKTKVWEIKNNLFQSLYHVYDKSLFVYNDYYQLSEEDRLFLETMVGLFF